MDKLKAQKLWDNTLLVFTTDNGGSLALDETAGNNYPLRGGKGTKFEGGIRATTFVNGGYLPDARRGQKEMGLISIADWYTLFILVILSLFPWSTPPLLIYMCLSMTHSVRFNHFGVALMHWMTHTKKVRDLF